MHDATKEIAMSELKALADFLQPYHDEVMGLERQALDALAKGDTEAYTASMKAKAEKMKALYPLTLPYLEKLPAAQAKPLDRTLHGFSASANNGLRVNSPFYWSALLWDDDAKPGDLDNLQKFINSLLQADGQ